MKTVSTFMYYREQSMPESPIELKPVRLGTSSMSPVNSLAVTAMQRPLSAGSNVSGPLNGTHSPESSQSGRTPSPPSLASSNSSQQLPPACGARQLSKLKRFLTTLIQFGTDISPEIGERVRSLVRALVNNHLSIEEFHSKLQEATNFPLRPFVIPFLKTNLPLLQRELLHCARMARQTPQQYLAHNEHVIFDPSRPTPLEGHDLSTTDVNENGKRVRSPDRPKENGLMESHLDGLHPAKRAHTLSPGSNPRVSPASAGSFPGSGGGSVRGGGEDLSLQRLERERYEREGRTGGESRPGSREMQITAGYNFQRSEPYDCHLERVEDEWKHLESMLHCVMDLVGRCRQALTTLQDRTRREREDLTRWVRHQNGVDPEVKKRADFMTESLRHTEDRVSEVKRRAVHVFPEEAVNEVKRQAMIELQKAVAAAEAKANELVSVERSKMEQAVVEARKQAQEEAMGVFNRQQESSENCWNCGRKASETCSGCNAARYCGSFCQHKDWESHHRVCGRSLVRDAANAPAATERDGASPALCDTADATKATGLKTPTGIIDKAPRQEDGSPSDENKGSAAEKAGSPGSSNQSSPRSSPVQSPATTVVENKDSSSGGTALPRVVKPACVQEEQASGGATMQKEVTLKA